MVRTDCRANGEEGLTLVEVLVAIIILGIGVMTMLSVLFAAGRFSSGATRENTACRIIEAVLDYSTANPGWAAPGPRENDPLLPIVTPDEGLVWRLEAVQASTLHAGDSSYDNVWLLKLKVAADSNDNGAYDDADWSESPVKPRGYAKYGSLDCSCETFIYKE